MSDVDAAREALLAWTGYDSDGPDELVDTLIAAVRAEYEAEGVRRRMDIDRIWSERYAESKAKLAALREAER